MSDAKAAPAPAPESAAPVAADASTAAAGADQTSTTKTTKGKGGAAAKKGAAASTSKAKKAAADKPAAVPTRTRPVREIKKPQEPGVSLAVPAPVRSTRTKAQPSKAAPKKPTVPVASIKIPKNRKTLPGGTYVWAKMPGFPFYPGVVVEENDKTIPPKVKSSKPSEAARDKSHLIKFAGAKDKVSWGWIPAALMQAFNESGASDSKIMKSQRYKTKKEQSEVRKWYRSSLAAIEAAGGEAGAKAKAALAAEKDGKLDELDDKMDEDADGEPVSNGDAAIEETA